MQPEVNSERGPKLFLIDLPKDLNGAESLPVIRLGAWAKSIDNLSELDTPDLEPYPTSETVHTAAKASIETADEIFDHLIQAIPKELGMDRVLPRRFWEVFIHRYVSHISGVVEDIKLRCGCIQSEETIYGAPTNEWRSPPQTLNEYIEQALSRSALRIRITDACIRTFLPNMEEHPVLYHETSKPIAGKNAEETRTGLRSRIKRTIRSIPFKLFTDWRDSHSALWDHHRLGPIDMLRLAKAGLSPVLANYQNTRTSNVRTEHDLRNRVFHALPKPYDQVLYHSFPVMALEGLRDTLDAGESIFKIQTAKTKEIYTFGQVWGSPEPMRSAVGTMAANGTKIISIQHGGGNYSSLRTFASTINDLTLSDVFITWGWKKLSGLNKPPDTIVPMPSIYLSKLAARKQQQIDWRVMFLVYSDWMYPAWLNSPIFPDLAHDYFRREKVLFENFKSESSCAVKLYPPEFGWGQNAWIAKEFPYLERIIEGRFPEIARRSSLCIVDYNSTGLLELLAMNRPFMATWNRKWYGGPPAFERHMDNLKDVGVFFDQPEELVNAYHKIDLDITSWWLEPLRQSAIKEMAKEYAATANDPISVLGQFANKRLADMCSDQTF